MKQIHEWAIRNRVPLHVVGDLLHCLGMGFDSPQPRTTAHDGMPMSEAAIQNNDRIDAASKGVLLFRNNVGVLADATGRPVRYGLANDSKTLNENVKSGDAIGIRPIYIDASMLGHTIGQFVSREYKPEGWRFTGAGRETAQAKWIAIINSKGGDAAFASNVGSV